MRVAPSAVTTNGVAEGVATGAGVAVATVFVVGVLVSKRRSNPNFRLDRLYRGRLSDKSLMPYGFSSPRHP